MLTRLPETQLHSEERRCAEKGRMPECVGEETYRPLRSGQ